MLVLPVAGSSRRDDKPAHRPRGTAAPEEYRNAIAPGLKQGPGIIVWIANILGGTVILFLGIIIRVFNASGLIAGYNTASAEEKAKYDERALTKFVGGLLIAASVILLARGILPAVAGISWALFMAIVIGGVVYMNTGERFRW